MSRTQVSVSPCRVTSSFIAMLASLVQALFFGGSLLAAQTFNDLHDFNSAVDGCCAGFPDLLTQGRDGNLYGTLPSGGASGHGTVFQATPGGTITVLHNFTGTDGNSPMGGLTLGSDGNFYGTTVSGGAHASGTIFKIALDGTFMSLYSFTGGADGGSPYGPPVLGKDGNYYGVTYLTSAYKITPSGTVTMLPNPIPGRTFAPLLLVSDGNFYSTTLGGGNSGNGTVFRLTSKGAVKVVYNFDVTHGRIPYGGLVQGSDGYLYGTTTAGGSLNGGVVFKVKTAGALTVLHEFDVNSTTDGYSPYAGLTLGTDGIFRGATSIGKTGTSAQYGTLFAITKTGTYSVLHIFDRTHGMTPYSTDVQYTLGQFYGMANFGGTNNSGVLYDLDAGLQPFVLLLSTSGKSGTTVGMLGNGFNGTTSVKFGSGSATFNVLSDNYLTAVVPTSGSTGAVTVTISSGTLKSSQTFKVLPAVSKYTPTSGPVGTQVTITGSGFTGATKVTFGSGSATFTVNSGTQITATVPAGATTGKVVVTTPGGKAIGPGTFTVN